MGELRPSLGNAGNWVDRWDTTKIASIATSEPAVIYNPIPPFECPLTFENFTFAVWVSTQSPKTTWKNGGLITANVITGLNVAGDNFSEVYKQWLTLNSVSIIRIPRISESVRLRFYPPRWFKSFAVAVWEYTGAGEAGLEAKIDAVYRKLP